MCSSVPSEQIEGAIWEMSCDNIYEREANVFHVMPVGF